MVSKKAFLMHFDSLHQWHIDTSDKNFAFLSASPFVCSLALASCSSPQFFFNPYKHKRETARSLEMLLIYGLLKETIFPLRKHVSTQNSPPSEMQDEAPDIFSFLKCGNSNCFKRKSVENRNNIHATKCTLSLSEHI